MTEMEYENYCEMLSVMDKPIKMKTVTLSSDIIDGKQRQHVDWNSINFRRNKLIEDIKNGEEIPPIVICKQNLVFIWRNEVKYMGSILDQCANDAWDVIRGRKRIIGNTIIDVQEASECVDKTETELS